MNQTLAGAGVIITRPVGQCEVLAGLVRAAGGLPVILPAMTIEPTWDAKQWPDALPAIDQYRLIVFISQNAVRLAAHYLQGSNADLAAVGPSTAKALQDLGHPVDVTSAGGFTSEALLEHPRLERLQDQRVLIIRGQGGRELLAQSMKARGATVDYLEVYCRAQTEISSAEVDEVRRLLAAGKIRFVTATSVQTVENTLKLLGPGARQLLKTAQLVSASDRVVKMAEELGLHAAVPAPGPSDQVLLQHMLRLSTKQASEHS